MNQKLQTLRTIDKFDKIGRDGVVELLQKPEAEFGANLMEWQANLIGEYLDMKGATNEETLANLKTFLPRATRISNRFKLIAAMQMAGKFDDFLALKTNADNTWKDGGRPENIAWALDDIAESFASKEETK